MTAGDCGTPGNKSECLNPNDKNPGLPAAHSALAGCYPEVAVHQSVVVWSV